MAEDECRGCDKRPSEKLSTFELVAHERFIVIITTNTGTRW